MKIIINLSQDILNLKILKLKKTLQIISQMKMTITMYLYQMIMSIKANL